MEQPILVWDPESMTYKVPHTYRHVLAKCGHVEFNDERCAEMDCPNYYINKQKDMH